MYHLWSIYLPLYETPLENCNVQDDILQLI